MAADIVRTWVQATAVRKYQGIGKAHDLTIDTTHSYYIVAGVAPLLVHNCRKYEDPDGDFIDKEPKIARRIGRTIPRSLVITLVRIAQSGHHAGEVEDALGDISFYTSEDRANDAGG